ncbi:Processing alpha glucosidase I [Blastocladiella emersonii ATCC 22665]|nr:Processing alpha glucosidase I [Blastocladiella emersonii ATCC 22665]
MKRIRDPMHGAGLAALAALAVLAVLTTTATAAAASPAAADARFWGTWRPNLYFGTRTRAPESLLTGLAWFPLNDYAGLQSVRHACDQAHKMAGYGYAAHNGRDYARQTVNDTASNLHLSTEWLHAPGGDHGGDWTVRVRGEPLDPTKPAAVALFYYAGLEGNGVVSSPHARDPAALLGGERKNVVHMLHGKTAELADFDMFVRVDPDSLVAGPAWNAPRVASLPIPKGRVWQIMDSVAQVLNLRAQQTVAEITRTGGKELPPPADLFSLVAPGDREDPDLADVTAAVAQINFAGPFTVDITFVSASAHPGAVAADVAATAFDTFASAAAERNAAFDAQFESTFGLTKRGFSAASVQMAKYALSNLLGGHGYFYGNARVNPTPDNEAAVFDWLYYPEDENEDDEAYRAWKAAKDARVRATRPYSLFTGTPSRSFFPRGFLWDEGFHQLLVQAWDPSLTRDVLVSWYATQDKDGWIAREQILGDEARSKVPAEFQVQSPHIANPPTLVLAARALAVRSAATGQFADPSVSDSFIGRASDSSTDTAAFLRTHFPAMLRHWEWYRATQAGIPDDFGRDAPSKEVYRWRGRTERHNFASGLDDYPRADPPHIGELHVDLTAWMAWQAQTLAALARASGHTAEAAELEAAARGGREALHALFWSDGAGGEEPGFGDLGVSSSEDESVRVVRRGYVSLLPFALGLVDPAAQPAAFKWSLQLIRELAAPGHGVRSLHPDDPAYARGEDYWRGAVWINWQYLVLGALHRARDASPEAEQLYTAIRGDVIRTVERAYAKAGFLFENYHGETGEPRGSHPFTGWSALVVLIMAEQYHH